ncbi:MAG: host attachment protein [Hyphomicrobium sp.]
MKLTTTWILIADGARARIFANLGPGKGITPVEGGVLKTDHAPSRELASDRPGRTFESADVMRHAIDPAQDPHRELKRAFAVRLAALLDERLARNAFDRLVLVAPPVTLGDLRAALSKPVKERVSAELDNDLTNTPVDELPKHLAAILPV